MSDPEPSYSIAFTRDARRDVASLDGSVKQQLKKALEKKLAIDPEGYGLPLRSPLTGYWKHAFSFHRLIYRIYRDRQLVVICAVGPRRAGDKSDVYEELEAVAKLGKVAGQLAEVLAGLGRKKKKPSEDCIGLDGWAQGHAHRVPGMRLQIPDTDNFEIATGPGPSSCRLGLFVTGALPQGIPKPSRL